MLDVKCTYEGLYVVDRMDMRRDAARHSVGVRLGLVYIHWVFHKRRKDSTSYIQPLSLASTTNVCRNSDDPEPSAEAEYVDQVRQAKATLTWHRKLPQHLKYVYTRRSSISW